MNSKHDYELFELIFIMIGNHKLDERTISLTDYNMQMSFLRISFAKSVTRESPVHKNI